MPQLSKKVLSQYVRTGCDRQLRLNLSPDNAEFHAERSAVGMPPKQRPRPGLEILTQAGEVWEAEKLLEMRHLFGAPWTIGTQEPDADGNTVFVPCELLDVLPTAPEGAFLIKPRFEAFAANTSRSTFADAMGLTSLHDTFGLQTTKLEPDLIQIRRPCDTDRTVNASGETSPIALGDLRRRLRIIDIKLTAEANAGYFTEIAFYSMALAGWLVDQGLDRTHVVVADAAIWPGSHDASAVIQYAKGQAERNETPTYEGLLEALASDLELLPFEVFAFRLKRMMRDDLARVLGQDWRKLDWHVDNRCSGCDYLGYPWESKGKPTNHPAHCMPQAEREGQLSRVAFMSKGCRATLERGGVPDVSDLAARKGADPVFETHQTLKASRSLIPPRAAALITQTAIIPSQTGSGAMPRWADLRISISCDFDVGSGISFAFGASAFWLERRDFGTNDTSKKSTKKWGPEVFVVPERSIDSERTFFLAFLGYLRDVMSDAQVTANQPGLQVYMWDRLTHRHLCKVVGRHLDAIIASKQGLAQLAWLFPSDDIVPNAEYSDSSTPITIVQDVVRAVLAAPIAHYYNLITVARVYQEPGLPDHIAKFTIHPLFLDELSDHVPSERAHEIWTKSTAKGFLWSIQTSRLIETVEKRLRALDTVVRRLQDDLKKLLVKNPAALPIRPPARNGGISVDGEMWLAFHKLNAALDELEVAQTRAMPPHEREARHRSARLEKRLEGDELSDALEQLGLFPAPGRRVYKMRPGSKQVKARTGDFNFALSPELDPRFPDESLFARCKQAGVTVNGQQTRWRMADATKVTIAAIDRGADLVAIDEKQTGWLDRIESLGLGNLSRNVVMDPVYGDLFGSKLEASLRGLGNPPSASQDPIIRKAVGSFLWKGMPVRTANYPAADFIWGAVATHAARCSRDVPLVRTALAERGTRLNDSQWMALEEALSRRLHLVWGPPGTGKSRTLRAIVAGAVVEAIATGRKLRILISAFTWNAIENLMVDMLDEVVALVPDAKRIHRLLSSWRDPGGVPARLRPFITPVEGSAPRYAELRTALAAEGVVICASTADQIRNMLKINNVTRENLFDLIVIDEASQMDVAHAIVALAATADGASLVLAGDPLQLAPIHKAEPPIGLEAMVGSIYGFFTDHHRIRPTMLERNYRSNSVIVDFVRTAGYEASLIAHSPNLRINLLTPLPRSRPADWPADMWWTPEYAEMLDPSRPVACFVYSEGTSSQWNEFEADLVCAMLRILNGRLANALDHELDFDGEEKPSSRTPHDEVGFWTKGVGVVTPHRAQQGLIVTKLTAAFKASSDHERLIRNAVDTVERFQGQQRDVIIASFALSDPDAIADEDEFLYNLNRFNVMASRARAKLIVLVSRELVDHLASEVETMRASRLVKTFVESFCNTQRPMRLGHFRDQAELVFDGSARWRGFDDEP